MVSPDFSSRNYITEVLKTNIDNTNILDSIKTIACGPFTEIEFEEEFPLIKKIDNDQIIESEEENLKIKMIHSYLPSVYPIHRASKVIISDSGEEIEIPRSKLINNKEHFLYDIIVAKCKNHIIVAVPYFRLAHISFNKIDEILSGTHISYEKLNINNLLLSFGDKSVKTITSLDESIRIELRITRCHLTYSSTNTSNKNLQHLNMSGENLGKAPEYKTLIKPLISPSIQTPGKEKIIITPTVIGSVLYFNGVKKTSAITDMYGNFKIWVSPGLRQLKRIFTFLSILEQIKNVMSTSTNLPIRRSKSIKNNGDE